MSGGSPKFDLTGAIHMHSRYSDGTGRVADIAKAAQANALDYVLLTDHDTLAARDRGEEGRHGGDTLVLVGEEVSPKRENHYLAFGLNSPIDHEGLSPQQIVDRVTKAGGFGFLAHPFSKGSERFKRGGEGMPWRDLDATGYTGVELWSFVTDTAERINSIRELVQFVTRPERFVDHPPRANLERWDTLCATRRCVAIGGIDAHQIGIRIGNRVPLRLMSYKRSFRYLHTHLLCDRALTGGLEDDRETIYSALRAGHAYIAIDSLHPATGFQFQANGARTLTMGDEAPAGELQLRAEVPRAARIRLLKDGDEIASAADATSLQRRVDDPGVYRVEVYLNAHGRERTWILSNPIYLR